MTQSPCIHGQYDRERGTVPGSYGHYAQDAQTFASWGVDYVKADFCDAQLPNGSLINAEQACERRSTPPPACACLTLGCSADPAFSRALNATGRTMYFLACFDRWLNKTTGGPKTGYRAPWEWIHPWANAYRLSNDHHDDWSQVRLEMEDNSNNAEYSVPGSFGDWDALITGGEGCLPPSPTPPPSKHHCQGSGAVDCGPAGGGPPGVRCPNMTQAEYRASFSVWVLGASPLMIDSDIRNMSTFQRGVLLHDEMLDIHADPDGVGGSRIGSSAGGEVWAKRLAGNETAVAVLNLRPEPSRVSFSFELLGYSASTELQLRDVWERRELGASTGHWRSAGAVPAHAAVVLRVRKSKG